MKRLMIPWLILGLFVISSCGKKAQEDGELPKTAEPQEAEILFNSNKDFKRFVMENNLEGLRSILEKFPSIDLNQEHAGDTLLNIAVKNDFLEVRNFLVENGAGVNFANHSGTTPLMIAVEYNRLNSVRFLTYHRANLEKVDMSGDTALHIALKKYHEPLALHLIKQGANVEAPDRDGKLPLRLAEENKLTKAYDLIRAKIQLKTGAPDADTFRSLLLEADAQALDDVLAKYPNIGVIHEDINPLEILINNGDETVSVYFGYRLIESGLNPNGKVKNSSPLIVAVKANNLEFASGLLRYQADPEIRDADGKTALILAAEKLNIDLVALLAPVAKSSYVILDEAGAETTFDACLIIASSAKEIKINKRQEFQKIRQMRRVLNCPRRGGRTLVQAEDGNQ